MGSSACGLDLLQVQEQLEGECMALGAAQFRQALANAKKNGDASRVGAYRHLLAHGIEPVQAALDLLIEESSRQRGRKHAALAWVAAVGTDVAAYMALKVALDSIATHATVAAAARSISSLILDELKYRRLREQAPQLYEYRLSSFTTSHYGHMKRSMDATVKYADVDVSDLHMSDTHYLLVGVKLLDVVAQVTGLFQLDRGATVRLLGRGRRRVRRSLSIVPTEETQRWLDAQNERMADFAHVNYPLVVPPLPWGPKQRGGYLYGMRNKFSLVRRYEHGGARPDDAEFADLPLVYETLNRMQNTAWRINADVLQLVRRVQAEDIAVPGLATLRSVVRPAPTPAERAARELLDAAAQGGRKNGKTRAAAAAVDQARRVWRGWRKRASAAKEQDRLRRVRMIEQGNVMRVAERMAQYDAIHFPFNCDFRGRIYTVSSYLNPQGDDLCKALLTFATGKPLGDSGAVWLAIHGANCLGVTPEGQKISKMTLDERVSWIVRHRQEIAAVVSDPFGAGSWWMQADEPLQFYAFCCEWRRALVEHDRTGQWAYVSSLPCGMDGSCNGLQHFSAMFRDPVGGRAVNLTNNDRPQDVYDAVANAVTEQLGALAAGGDDLAQRWLASELVNRKLCKRPTMTFGYGSKKWGFRDQLLSELHKRDDFETAIKPRFTALIEGNEKSVLAPACTLLSAQIEESLGRTVVAAAQAMRWLQDCATKIVSVGSTVTWRVPMTGFPVRQEYYRPTKHQIKTTLAGSIVQPAVFTQTLAVLPHKQINAVAPNVVHSLDAAALMLTVTQAGAAGIESFGMIHDSFSTVAADCEQLAQVTRAAFVQLYTEHDVPAELHAQFAAQAPEGIPLPPAKGSLDLSEVLRSQYFFA